ncbi:sugar phosphate isomerase/epimerase family protein [Alkalicoccobacillus porphyridii]|uniref:Sugar phosphate isomerase/epimerase n=1 Tax=Alkalicoccobacillus porphyridii TaxID=2597270 RepID=A0A554A069_9BACI|nr:sugar phosphate isomerase/epimerase [Alkalicoccobacillus porphyridii]TSB47036.1 sugar phosphate isomerase/epimerase [Alkalicoccobacillus porphyridii]
MKLAFSSPTKTEAERNILFTRFRSIGYEGLQLKPPQYSPYIKDASHFLEVWGEQKGMASALIAGGSLDEQNQDDLRNLFSFSEKVGVERIVFCHGISRKKVSNSDIKDFAKTLSELGLEARQQYGVGLSLHHHHDQPVMYREDFDVFFDQVKENTVTLTIDTAHLYKSGIQDISEVIDSFGNFIDNFHLKDFAQGQWKVLGEGEIDFAPVFHAIKKLNFQGWVSADEESGGDLQQGMEDCYTYMSKGLSYTSL